MVEARVGVAMGLMFVSLSTATLRAFPPSDDLLLAPFVPLLRRPPAVPPPT